MVKFLEISSDDDYGVVMFRKWMGMQQIDTIEKVYDSGLKEIEVEDNEYTQIIDINRIEFKDSNISKECMDYIIDNLGDDDSMKHSMIFMINDNTV